MIPGNTDNDRYFNPALEILLNTEKTARELNIKSKRVERKVQVEIRKKEASDLNGTSDESLEYSSDGKVKELNPSNDNNIIDIKA